MTVFVIYKQGWPVAVGTADELAERLGVKPETVKFLATPTNIRRAEGKPGKMLAVRVEVDE